VDPTQRPTYTFTCELETEDRLDSQGFILDNQKVVEYFNSTYQTYVPIEPLSCERIAKRAVDKLVSMLRENNQVPLYVAVTIGGSAEAMLTCKWAESKAERKQRKQTRAWIETQKPLVAVDFAKVEERVIASMTPEPAQEYIIQWRYPASGQGSWENSVLYTGTYSYEEAVKKAEQAIKHSAKSMGLQYRAWPKETPKAEAPKPQLETGRVKLDSPSFIEVPHTVPAVSKPFFVQFLDKRNNAWKPVSNNTHYATMAEALIDAERRQKRSINGAKYRPSMEPGTVLPTPPTPAPTEEFIVQFRRKDEDGNWTSWRRSSNTRVNGFFATFTEAWAAAKAEEKRMGEGFDYKAIHKSWDGVQPLEHHWGEHHTSFLGDYRVCHRCGLSDTYVESSGAQCVWRQDYLKETK